MKPKFKVGDKVIFNPSDKSYYGEIVSLDKFRSGYKVIFDKGIGYLPEEALELDQGYYNEQAMKKLLGI